MVSRELQAQAGLLQAQPGDLGLADRLVLVAYRLVTLGFLKINKCRNTALECRFTAYLGKIQVKWCEGYVQIWRKASWNRNQLPQSVDSRERLLEAMDGTQNSRTLEICGVPRLRQAGRSF